MVRIQRRILLDASERLDRRGGRLLYTTCALERAENERQVEWAADRLGLRVERTELTLPGGTGRTYHDGSFYAVLTSPAADQRADEAQNPSADRGA